MALDLRVPVMPSRVTEWVRCCPEVVPMLEREGWMRFDEAQQTTDDGFVVLKREVPYV